MRLSSNLLSTFQPRWIQSQGGAACPGALELLTPARWEGDCHLCHLFCSWAVQSVHQLLSASLLKPPRKSSHFSSMGPLHKAWKYKYDVLLPSAHKGSCQRAAWHQIPLKLSQNNYYGVFRKRWRPSSTSWGSTHSFPAINTPHSPNCPGLNFPEAWGQVLHSQLYPNQFTQISANHLHLTLQKEPGLSLQETEIKSAKQEAPIFS